MNRSILASLALTTALCAGAGVALAGDDGDDGAAYGFTDEAAPESDGDVLDADGDLAPEAAVTAGAPRRTRMWGVGGARTISGIAGPNLDVHVGDRLYLNAVLGVAISSGDPGQRGVGLAAGAFFSLSRRGPVALSLGGRLGISHFGTGGDGVEVPGYSQQDIHLEAPLRVDWEVREWLSLHVEGGGAIRFVDGGEGGEGSTAWGIGGGGLLAGGGFTLYL